MEYDFHGIIVQESLKDSLLLNDVIILGRKQTKDWELIRVGIMNSEIEEFIEAISDCLRVEESIPYYAHFYSRNKLIVVFPHKVFNVTPDKETWKLAIKYGLSRGIPLEQLDFFPCKFEDETY